MSGKAFIAKDTIQKELAQQSELQIKSWKSRIKIQELISKQD